MSLAKLININFKGWFGNRMPVADVVELTQRCTYVWPTRAGFLVLFIIILMMIGATNYQNNLAFLLTFLVVGIGLVSIVFTFKNLQGMRFSLLPLPEVYCNDPVTLSFCLHSQTGTAHYSIAVGESEDSMVVCDVPAGENTNMSLSTQFNQRGYQQLPRIKATSQFPFGWLRTWAYFRFKSLILVYPQAIEPPADFQQRSSGSENQDGKKVSGSEDLYGLKPYQQGEPLARVDWKSFARERGMYTREFAAYQSQLLCFNFMDYPEVGVETRLSYLTYMVLQAAHQNLTYSLMLPDKIIPMGDGESQRQQSLQALALYTKEPVQ